MQLKANILNYRATVALIAVNFALYIAIICGVDSNWFALSSSPEILASKPWTLLTYMFTQAHAGHLLVNMALFALAGYYYESKTSSLRLALVYVAGGLVGALAFMLICLAANSDSALLIGSSASALAVWTAIVMDRVNPMPDMTLFLFGRVKPVWLLLIYLCICVIGLFGSNPGGNMAHIGGMVAGAVAGRLRKVNVTPRRKDILIEKAERSGFASLSDEERRQLFEKYRKSGK